jgi:hypothetical protein
MSRARFFVLLAGWPRRLAAASFAAVLLVSTLSFGHAYLWCGPMQRALSACCCAPGAGASDVDAGGASSSMRSACCCESRSFGDLPTATRTHRGLAPPAELPLTALPEFVGAPKPRWVSSTLGEPRGFRWRPIRAGPRDPSSVRALFQVWRC